jgi:hypothetical protein
LHEIIPSLIYHFAAKIHKSSLSDSIISRPKARPRFGSILGIILWLSASLLHLKMRPSSDTERTQVPTRTNSAEHLDTLSEKQTNMTEPVNEPDLRQPPSRQQYDDTFDDNEVLEGSGEDSDVEKGNVEGGNERAEQLKRKESKQKDPNLIEWDGPEDPENPMNWPTSKKWIVTLALGMMTFCVTFASSVFSNATVPVAELFGVSTEVTTLGTSLFVLGFGAGPLVSFSLHNFHPSC